MITTVPNYCSRYGDFLIRSTYLVSDFVPLAQPWELPEMKVSLVIPHKPRSAHWTHWSAR